MLQRRKTCAGQACGFVQIDAAVDLNLQAVAAICGLANAANQRHTFVRLVIGHAIATGLQGITDEMDERRVTGAAIPIPQHKVGQVFFWRPQALVHITGHGVQVEVPHAAKAVYAPANGLRQRRVVGLPVVRNALLDLSHAEFAVIHRRGLPRLVDLLPHQPQTLQRLGPGVQRHGPCTVQHRRVDVIFLAVGVDVGAGEGGLYQRCAVLGPGLPQLIDQAVFPPAQQRQGQGKAKICGIRGAAVRRVTHQRQHRALRRMHQYGGIRAGLQKIKRVLHQSILMLARLATAV